MGNIHITLRSGESVEVTEDTGGAWVVLDSSTDLFDLTSFSYTLRCIPVKGQQLTGRFMSRSHHGGTCGMRGNWALESPVAFIREL